MMSSPPTHAELLSLWRPYRALADALDVTQVTALRWRSRGEVPSRYWPGLIAALKEHFGLAVTADDLAAGGHGKWLAFYRPYSDLADALGVGYTTALQWRARGRVPSAYWPAFIAVLKQRFGVVVTTDELAACHAAIPAPQDSEAA